MKTTKTTQQTVEIRLCDICSKESSKICWICRKDLCSGHIIFDDRDHGDYPATYCSRCWEIGTPFRQQLYDLELKYESDVETIENSWHSAC